MFYNILDDSEKLCRLSQHGKCSQTESACIATSKHKSHDIMFLLRDIKLLLCNRIFLSRDKSVDLDGALSRRATLFECLRQNHLSLRQVSMMWRQKPDLLLFRSMTGTGDLLSN